MTARKHLSLSLFIACMRFFVCRGPGVLGEDAPANFPPPPQD